MIDAMLSNFYQGVSTNLGGGAAMMAGGLPELGQRAAGSGIRGFLGGPPGVLSAPGWETRQYGPAFFDVAPRQGGLPQLSRIVGDASGIPTAGRRMGSFSIQGHGNVPLVNIAKGGVPAATGIMSMAGPAIGGGFSAYMMYSGFQENGFKGAFDAGVLELSMNTAMWNLAYSRTPVMGIPEGMQGYKGSAMGGPQRAKLMRLTQGRRGWGFHTPTMLAIGAGAYIGGGMGQELAGPVGAFAGAFMGGAAMTNPLKAATIGLALGGATMIGKGAYSLLKTGYRKGRMKRSIDTAGDTAAFFTRNAMTMRSRAVQAIHKSHTNARSALGQEATFMHSGRDYFSTYRQQGNMM